jgi:hypothetical protein
MSRLHLLSYVDSLTPLVSELFLCLMLSCFLSLSSYLTQNTATVAAMATKCDSLTWTDVRCMWLGTFLMDQLGYIWHGTSLNHLKIMPKFQAPIPVPWWVMAATKSHVHTDRHLHLLCACTYVCVYMLYICTYFLHCVSPYCPLSLPWTLFDIFTVNILKWSSFAVHIQITASLMWFSCNSYNFKVCNKL